MQYTTCTVPECRALVTVGEKVGNRQKSAGEAAHSVLTHVALQRRSIVALQRRSIVALQRRSIVAL